MTVNCAVQYQDILCEWCDCLRETEFIVRRY